ncbi:MAG: hypothetical protein AAFX06_32540 [Planctomycetota bacterium]
MTSSQRLEIVRAHLLAWLRSNQPEEADSGLSESILIADGFFAGRTFRSGSVRAEWFMESEQLKIRGAGGEVIAVFQGDEIGSTTEPDVIRMPDPDQDEPPLPKAA